MNLESSFNSERISSIDKVVAKNSEEKKEAENYFVKTFSEQKWKDLEVKELEKTKEQVEIINLVNEESNRLLEKYGLEKFDITGRNIHLLNKNDFDVVFGKELEKKNINALSGFAPKGQFVVLSLEDNITKSLFVKKIFHEAGIHFKSFQAAYVKDTDRVMGQCGLLISPKLNEEKKDTYFFNINEAVTEELTKRFCNNIIKKHPDFEEETRLIEEYVENKKKEGKKINGDDIIAARKDGQKISAGRLSYRVQRNIFNTLVDKLFERNKNQFNNREEVFDIFAKSVFTGDIVGKNSWGKLIDKTFPRPDGSSTLKELAYKDANLEELKDFVDEL